MFGPSLRDRLVGDLRIALSYRDGWTRQYDAACAKLGWANGTRLQYRRANQADAMRALNKVRAARRANLRAIAVAEAALLALDSDLFGGVA